MVAMAIRSGLWSRPFFLVSVSRRLAEPRSGRRRRGEGGTDGVESRAYARAEQEQSNLEKAKGSVDEGRPVYESKKRIAARP